MLKKQGFTNLRHGKITWIFLGVLTLILPTTPAFSQPETSASSFSPPGFSQPQQGQASISQQDSSKPETFNTIQAATASSLQAGKLLFEKISKKITLPVRLEKINNTYAVRVGLSKILTPLRPHLKTLRENGYPDAFLRNAYYLKKNIVMETKGADIEGFITKAPLSPSGKNRAPHAGNNPGNGRQNYGKNTLGERYLRGLMAPDNEERSPITLAGLKSLNQIPDAQETKAGENEIIEEHPPNPDLQETYILDGDSSQKETGQGGKAPLALKKARKKGLKTVAEVRRASKLKKRPPREKAPAYAPGQSKGGVSPLDIIMPRQSHKGIYYLNNDSAILRQQAIDLYQRFPNSVRFGYKIDTTTGLDTKTSTVAYNYSRDDYSFEFEVNHYQFNADPTILNIDEDELGLKFNVDFLYRLDRGELRLGMGLDHTLGNDLLFGDIEYTHSFYEWLQGLFKISLNEVTEEGPPIRVGGARDSVSALFLADITRYEYVSLNSTLRRYTARGGGNLGNGFGMDLEVGRRIFLADPSFKVRIIGSRTRNHVAHDMPGSMAMLLGPAATPESAVLSEFTSIALGATIEHGLLENAAAVATPFSFLFDVNAGWLWPENSLTYTYQAGIGATVFGRDQLSINAYYSNSQSGTAALPIYYIGIKYSLRLGR